MLRSLDEHQHALDTCMYCPKLCRFACPVAVAEGRDTVTPWGLMTRVNLVRRGQAAFDRVTAATWEHCTGCTRCQRNCKHNNDVRSSIYAARAESARAGLASPALLDWAHAPQPDVPAYRRLREGGEIVLLPGYAPAANIEAALVLLAAAGMERISRPSRGVFRAGGRLLKAGLPGEYVAEGRRVVRMLDRARRVICLDPADAVALRRDLPAERLVTSAAVQHLTEVLGEARDRLAPRLGVAIDGDVLYLDSCRLGGGGLGIYDAPRALLRHVIGGAVREATMSRDQGGCCGYGSGFAATHPITAARAAREAAEDVPGVPVVTAGPVCAEHLRSAHDDRPVHDLVVLLASALDAPTET